MEAYEKLIEAKKLFDDGIITEDEYAALKTRLLRELDNDTPAQTDSHPKAEPHPKAEVIPSGTSQTTTAASSTEGASAGMKVLCFLLPIVGLILFLLDREKKPVAAKDEIKFAAIGFGVGLVSYIILVALGITASMYY